MAIISGKEWLRDKFTDIVLKRCYFGDPVRRKYSEETADFLMAAVDEIIGKPIQIFVAPTEEQLEKLREAIRKDTSILIYGEPR